MRLQLLGEEATVVLDEYGIDQGYNRVLALHGWMDNAGTWAKLAPLLAAEPLNQYVVCLDFPGHGRSFHKGATSSYALMETVQDTLMVIRKLKWTNFTILAHSMGAAVAFVVAGVIASSGSKDHSFDGMHVDRLIAVDAPGPFSMRPGMAGTAKFVRAIGSAMSDNVARLESLARDEDNPSEAVTQESASTRPHAEEPPMPRNREHIKKRPEYASVEEAATVRMKMDATMKLEDAICIVRPALVQSPKSGLYTFCHDVRIKCRSLTQYHEEDITAIYDLISAPVFLILAEHGIVTAAIKSNPLMTEGFKLRMSHLRDYREKTVPDCGHHLHLSHAQEVYALLLDFFHSTPVGTTGIIPNRL